MLPVFFTHKRFVLLSGKAGRAMAKIVRTTPARVDLLLRLVEGPILQRDLVIEMGVCDAVVSRMLAAIEKLGFVKRTIYPRDRRMRIVTLLDEGRRRVEKLYDGIIPEAGLGTVQLCSEGLVFDDWEQVIAANGAPMRGPDGTNQRGLLERMLYTITRTNYDQQWFGTDLQPPLEVHDYRSNYRSDYRSTG